MTLRESDNLYPDFPLNGMRYQALNWHRAAFETLKGTGALHNIRSIELVAARAVRDQAEARPQEFPTVALHEHYKDSPLPLLATDADQIRVLTNVVIDLRRTALRPNSEVPAIMKQARQLIELLNAVYPQ